MITPYRLSWLALIATLVACRVLAAPIEVIDSQGRTVALTQPAERIVALAPHTTENAFSAGAGSKLVGVVEYSDYPEAARSIERVGSYQAWSMEKILALQPDLVLLWGSGSGLAKLQQLEALGLTVYISEPRRLPDIPASIRDIARLAGTGDVGEVEARRIESGLAQLEGDYANTTSLSIFYQIWNDPLQTINGEHMISDVMRLCGGRNVFADAVSLAPKINLEAVLKRDPDVILASGMDQARPEWLDEWLAYPHLRAVQEDALLFVNPDHLQRPTSRILLGAQSLCEQLRGVRQATSPQ